MGSIILSTRMTKTRLPSCSGSVERSKQAVMTPTIVDGVVSITLQKAFGKTHHRRAGVFVVFDSPTTAERVVRYQPHRPHRGQGKKSASDVEPEGLADAMDDLAPRIGLVRVIFPLFLRPAVDQALLDQSDSESDISRVCDDV